MKIEDPLDGFCLLEIKPDALAAQGLPNCQYPVPVKAMAEFLDAGGRVPPAQLLVWMQQYVQHDKAPWRDYLAPMRNLMERLAPDDPRQEIRAEGDNWALVCGPVDLDRALIAFCRQGEFLAAAQKHESGCLQVSCYQPLDARTCQTILGGSLKPAPDGKVCMRPNNWEYLADISCGNGQMYACVSGSSHMAFWKFGFGITAEHTVDPAWYPKRDVHPFQAAALADLLGRYYELTADSTL